MKVLSIETSCDETAVSLLDCSGDLENPKFAILGNKLYSQMKKHKEYGGVYPMLAKREHAMNATPLLLEVIREAGVETEDSKALPEEKEEKIREMLSREPEMADALIEAYSEGELPQNLEIDAIVVTAGPGLEPALWVGINFAKALSILWNKPLYPVNHMEGHIVSVLLHDQEKIQFPLLSLLVSGGHTELVLGENWGTYKKIGQKRDDAVGEAFDKVARMLGLPYPGGPEIDRLASVDRERRGKEEANRWSIPRPMINSGDYDFSFSGLKTAVLYTIRDIEDLTDGIKQEIAREFSDAALDVLIKKTRDALIEFGPKSLIVGGGVIANSVLRQRLKDLAEEFQDLTLFLPERSMATDNAIMIGIAGYLRILSGEEPADLESIKATGRLSLEE